MDLIHKARFYQFGRKQGCVSSSSEVASIQFVKEVRADYIVLLKVNFKRKKLQKKNSHK